MIRKLFPVLLIAGLTACASSGTQQTSSDSTSSYSSAGASSGDDVQCDAQSIQNRVGQKYSESLNRELTSSAHATQLRVLKPGELITMEYNAGRLNVIIEKDGSISALRCG